MAGDVRASRLVIREAFMAGSGLWENVNRWVWKETFHYLGWTPKRIDHVIQSIVSGTWDKVCHYLILSKLHRWRFERQLSRKERSQKANRKMIISHCPQPLSKKFLPFMPQNFPTTNFPPFCGTNMEFWNHNVS